MESSLPAGFRPKTISLNVGVLTNQMLGLPWHPYSLSRDGFGLLYPNQALKPGYPETHKP